MSPNVQHSLSIFVLEYLNINLIINRTWLKTLVTTKFVSATKILGTEYIVKNLALPKERTGYYPLFLGGNLCHTQEERVF